MDFLTITCHSAYNYGAVLQTYGLYKYLKDCGQAFNKSEGTK